MISPSLFLLFVTVVFQTNPTEAQPEYDPLQVKSEKVDTLSLVARDPTRDRDIPLRVYLPRFEEDRSSGITRELSADTSIPAAVPVLLFSHGLGGSRDACQYLGKHWSSRNYVAVFMQHAGSDETVWSDVPLRERRQALQRAASRQNSLARTEDVHAVLEQLSRWQNEEGHPLYGRLDTNKIGMSGHSFGARTTQAVAGQRSVRRTDADKFDGRIHAAIMFSPSVPEGMDPKRAFGQVSIPWLLMTGTKDDSPIGNTTPESRLRVYPALPPGSKYELVLHNAEHSAFNDRAGSRLIGRGTKNPNHHVAIKAISTAFWDAHLREETSARAWLDGPSVHAILDPQDRWQKK